MARRARTHDDLRALIRDKGLRATPSRVATLHLLRSQGQPISHSEAAERLSARDLDRATVYRNLTDLADVGLARRTDHGDHVWRFEAVTAGHEHPHFVCTTCGGVECLPDVQLSHPKVAKAARARPPRALRANEVEIQIRGVCDACR
jgi:Fur family ferric uptake transcriptional regulator